ncbi:hypothetical protein ME121_2026 [Methylobacterium sp. ME121]|nr:hypothetical protein ME121_2026 [Methylobacterium sp. ME121]
MTSEQRYAWQLQLHLKLRMLSGVAFQDFFADVMTRAHRDDFIKTRPLGTLGDRGCDGYLASVGRAFACYGKVDDAAPSVPSIIEKMDEDFAKASGHLRSAMKEWHFVHNLLDGTATDATVIKLEEMRLVHGGHKFGHFGRAGFEDAIFGMHEADIISLIGMAVTAEDTRNMKIKDVADLVDGIMTAIDETPFDGSIEPKPVPSKKLEINKIPPHWRHTIRGHMGNIPLIEDYFGQHLDAERGEKVAALFKARYVQLREQGLAAGDIMQKLYEGIVGIGTVTNDRIVAAGAILTFLFDACNIFEDKPGGTAA